MHTKFMRVPFTVVTIKRLEKYPAMIEVNFPGRDMFTFPWRRLDCWWSALLMAKNIVKFHGFHAGLAVGHGSTSSKRAILKGSNPLPGTSIKK